MRRIMFGASALALILGAGSAFAGDDNQLFVEQVGNANFQFADQSAGDSNETYIEQNGFANSAGASLTDPITGVANRNDALISQEGNRNVASWAFNNNNDNMLRNDLGIVQDGSRNFANFILTDQGQMTDSTLFIEQTGDDNYVSSSQSAGGTFGAGNGTAGSFVALPDFATFGLDGPQNSTFSTVGSDTNSIRGVNNFVGLRQNGSANAVHLTVQGSDNVIGGSGSSALGGFNNYTTTTGFFDGDTAFASLSGTLALQEGDNNVGVIRVDGINNAVAFTQIGFDNTAEVYQQGNDNAAAVMQ